MTPGSGLSLAPLMKAKAKIRTISTARNSVVYSDLLAAPLDAQVLAQDRQDVGEELGRRARPAPGGGAPISHRCARRTGRAARRDGSPRAAGSRRRATRPRRRMTTCSVTAAAASRSCVTRIDDAAGLPLGGDHGGQPGRPGRVQGRARLVEQQQIGLRQQGPGQRQALLHPAGERAGRGVGPDLGQPDPVEQGTRPGVGVVVAEQRREEAKVLAGGQIPVNPGLVADVTDAAAQRRAAAQAVVAPAHRPAAGRDQGREDAEHGRLAGAVGTEHGGDPGGLEGEGHVVQGPVSAVRLADPVETERGRRGHWRPV